MERRHFLTAAATTPFLATGAVASTNPTTIRDAYAEYEDIAKTLVPDGFEYMGTYCCGDDPLVVASNGDERINLFLNRSTEWEISNR